MTTQDVPLTEAEVGLLLGVRHTFATVPFQRVKKRPLNHRDFAVSEAVKKRLLALRNAAKEQLDDSEQGATGADTDLGLLLSLTDEEVTLYIKMTQVCLEELGDDETRLRQHLFAVSREQIEGLLEKLQQMLPLFAG